MSRPHAQARPLPLSRAFAIIALLISLIAVPILASAQDREAMKVATPAVMPTPDAVRLTGRLPNHYASAANVSDEQRQQIYAIQNEYDAQIEDLLDQIEELRGERDDRVRDVLSPEQQAKVETARQQARERRASRRER